MRAVDQHAPLHRHPDRRGPRDRQVDANHHPPHPHLADDRQFLLQFLEVRAEPRRLTFDVLQDPILQDRFDGRQPGGHRQRIAPKRAGVLPGLQALRDFVGGDDRPARHSPRQPLGQRQDVGLHVPLLIAKPRSQPGHPCLHFVENQQGAGVVGDFPQSRQEVGVGNVHTPFPLHWFDQDSGGLVRAEFPHRIEVVPRGVVEPGNQRADSLVILRLRGRGHRGIGPAMKTVFKADDAEPPRRRAMQSRQLDRPLVRLGPAVAEERLAKAAGAEGLGKLTLRLGVPGVGDVDEMLELILDPPHKVRGRIAQDVAAPAGEEVKIAVSLGVPDVRPFPLHQADGVAGVIGDHVLVEQVDGGVTGALGVGMHAKRERVKSQDRAGRPPAT